MIKSVSKARKRYQDQLEKTKTGEQQKSTHGGLAGRPNLSSLSASDPEILRNWKYLACTRLSPACFGQVSSNSFVIPSGSQTTCFVY